MLQAAAKSTADQLDIDLHIVEIESDRLRRRVTHILWNLGRRPDLALGTLKVRSRVTRLHGSMRHERQLVRRLDEASGKLCDTTRRIERYALLRGCLPKRVHDCGSVQVLVGAFVPIDLQPTLPFHRTPYAVRDNRDRGVGKLAHIA